jgi:hypothetical protein
LNEHRGSEDAAEATAEAAGDDAGRAAPPALVRVVAASWLRTAEWAVRGWMEVGSRFVDVVSGRSPETQRASSADGAEAMRRRDTPPPSALRERGAELLRQSADVHFDDTDVHPAYARILDALAPDEARILRLLAVQGPQPSVDLRTATPLRIGSELLAPGLTMIGAEAGCRHTDRVHAYLNNLYRLGLVWFSREPVTDRLRYQVLESQPEVAAAMKQARRTRTVRRSIHLTPFGHDFCEVCLPLETGELEALGHEEQADSAEAP